MDAEFPGTRRSTNRDNLPAIPPRDRDLIRCSARPSAKFLQRSAYLYRKAWPRSGGPTTPEPKALSAIRPPVADLVAHTWGYGRHEQQLQRISATRQRDGLVIIWGWQPGARRPSPVNRCSIFWKPKSSRPAELRGHRIPRPQPRTLSGPRPNMYGGSRGRPTQYCGTHLRHSPVATFPFQNGWEDKEFITPQPRLTWHVLTAPRNVENVDIPGPSPK